MSTSSKNTVRSQRLTPRFSLLSFFTGPNQLQNSTSSTRKHKSKHKKSKTSKEESTTPEIQISIEEATPKIRTNEDGSQIRECTLCYDTLELANFPEISTCRHRSCENCMEQYLKIEIGESRVDVTCPECTERMHPTDIHKLVRCRKTINKYEEFMVRRVLVTDPDTRWCPAPDCGFAVIARGCAPCPMLTCQRPGCNTKFCYHCKQEWHANQTCDAARLERLPFMQLSFSESLPLSEEYKPCPRCKTLINKMNDGSCNHMACSICGARFCWLCLKEASDLHYLSPSGCTFWGKKPWSKKKKILWQIGTLIGAPVGIALLAGLSVPILVVGLPIWAARKLYQKFKNKSKHKRNAIITFGTIAAFIASPVVAGVAVAVGVPIMLAYVYCVVPISLYRGGACGVKTKGPFSLGMGDSEVIAPGAVGDRMDHLHNPSIAESVSLAAVSRFSTSLSQIDHDVENLLEGAARGATTASMRNLGDNSMSGSIYYNDDQPQHKRVEIHADVTPQTLRKDSYDESSISHGDNNSTADNRSVRSTDTRSHVSFQVDNESTRALAGSICAPREREGSILGSINDTAETKSLKKVRGEHGSPISNRSVSFANIDDSNKSNRLSLLKRKSKEKSDRHHLKSFDSANASELPTPSDETLTQTSELLSSSSNKRTDGQKLEDSPNEPLTKVEINSSGYSHVDSRVSTAQIDCRVSEETPD